MKRALALAALLLTCAPAGSARARVESHPWWSAHELQFSPDGRFAYAAGKETLVLSADPATGQLTPVSSLDGESTSLALSPDGRFVYAIRPNALVLYRRDATSGLLYRIRSVVDSLTAPYPTGDGSQIRLSPGGGQVVIAEGRGLLVLARDAASGDVRVQQELFGDPSLEGADEVLFAPNGRQVYLRTPGGVVTIDRDPATGELSPRPGEGPVGNPGLAMSPDGLRLYEATSGFAWLDRDPATGDLTSGTGSTFGGLGGGGNVSVAPDGTRVALIDRSTVVLHDAASGAETQRLPLPPPQGAPLSSWWSPDSASLYVLMTTGPLYNYGGDSIPGRIAVFHRAAGGDFAPGAGLVPTTHVAWETGNRVSIDEGALYTNDPAVTLEVHCPFAGSDLKLSNTPDLAAAPLLHLAEDYRYPWTLASAPLARDVRRVCARCEPDGFPTITMFDDIVLDQRPPTVVSATATARATARRRAGRSARGRVVIVRARDSRTDVARMQLTRHRSRPAKPVRYHLRSALPKGKGALWVRVYDGAGNRSRWRRVTSVTHRK